MATRVLGVLVGGVAVVLGALPVQPVAASTRPRVDIVQRTCTPPATVDLVLDNTGSDRPVVFGWTIRKGSDPGAPGTRTVPAATTTRLVLSVTPGYSVLAGYQHPDLVVTVERLITPCPPPATPTKPSSAMLTARVSGVLGITTAIRGRMRPNLARQRVTLQLHTGHSWANAAVAMTSGRGNYGFDVRPVVLGTARYRLVNSASAQLLPSVLGSLSVVRYRAAISSIHADAAGDDARNLNDEYVTLRNTGPVGVNLAGWVLRDAAGRRAVLPRFGLRPAALVRVHTGGGRIGAGDAFLGLSSPFWENGTDVGRLVDPNGTQASVVRTPAPARSARTLPTVTPPV